MKTAETDGTIIEFLLGSHPYDGVWFGDQHPEKEGWFWWRKALRDYASHPSPMSAEQVEELGYYYPLFKFFSDEHGLSLLDSQLQDVIHECKKFIEPASPSVKADGWVSVEDELPKVGQKVDLWLVPDDEEKSYRMTWTWEKESTARITINGCKVTHWQPFTPPKQHLQTITSK